MFESAIIRRHANGEQFVDAGVIAETLLFYRSIHILAYNAVLVGLLKTIGADNLIRMLDMKVATISFYREMLGVYSDKRNGVDFHKFVSFEITADKNKKPIRGRDDFQRIVDTTLGKSWKSKKIGRQLLDRVPLKRLSATPGSPNDLINQARAELGDPVFVKEAVRSALPLLVPGFQPPDDFRMRISPAGDDYVLVDTNLDFQALNKEYHKIVPPSHSTLGPADLIGYILHARADMYLAADYMSEIITTDLSATIIGQKFQNLLQKRKRNAEQIADFQNVYLNNIRAVREAINSGSHSFADFLSLLEKAQKFKEWLGERNPDTNLIEEYSEAVMRQGWIEKLPAKSVRFVITTLAGLAADALLPTGGIGTAIGVVTGAADSFLIDRLARGWRPNQFVERDLREFAQQT